MFVWRKFMGSIVCVYAKTLPAVSNSKHGDISVLMGAVSNHRQLMLTHLSVIEAIIFFVWVLPCIFGCGDSKQHQHLLLKLILILRGLLKEKLQ